MQVEKGDRNEAKVIPMTWNINYLDIYVLQVICSKLELKDRVKFERINLTFFGLCNHLWATQTIIPEEDQLNYQEYQKVVVRCPNLKILDVKRLRDASQDKVSVPEMEFSNLYNFPATCSRIEAFNGNPSVHFVANYLKLNPINNVKKITVTRDFLYDYQRIIEDIKIIAVNATQLKQLDFFSFIIPDGDNGVLDPYYQMIGQRVTSVTGYNEELEKMQMGSKLEHLGLKTTWMSPEKIPANLQFNHSNLRSIDGRFKNPAVIRQLIHLPKIQEVTSFWFTTKYHSCRDSFILFIRCRGHNLTKLGLLNIKTRIEMVNESQEDKGQQVLRPSNDTTNIWNFISDYCPNLQVLKINFDKSYDAHVEDQELSIALNRMKSLELLNLKSCDSLDRIKSTASDLKIRLKYKKLIRPKLWAECGPFF